MVSLLFYPFKLVVLWRVLLGTAQVSLGVIVDTSWRRAMILVPIEMHDAIYVFSIRRQVDSMRYLSSLLTLKAVNLWALTNVST
jgi:hypothetical protein